MILRKGNMFDEDPSLFNRIIITGNSIVKPNGRLVMGAGAAKDLRDKVKGIDLVFGKKVSDYNSKGKEYLLLFHNFYGILQVKYNWWENANVDLIGRSLERLKYYSNKYPKVVYNLNYPGIGYGGIERHIMENILCTMNFADNVVVWEL